MVFQQDERKLYPRSRTSLLPASEFLFFTLAVHPLRRRRLFEPTGVLKTGISQFKSKHGQCTVVPKCHAPQKIAEKYL